MAVTNEEANNAYEVLVLAARSSGLDWIVREVEEEVALGRVELRSLPVQDLKYSPPEELFANDKVFPDGPPKTKRRSRATFNVSRPLTPQERLLLLTDSLEAGVVELNGLADTVLHFIADELGQERLVFAPEADVKPAVELSVQELRARREATSRLSLLLSELERDILNADPTAATQ